MPSRSAGRSFAVSAECRDVSKPCSAQIWRRTAARASEKAGRFLRYHAAADTRRRVRRPARAAGRGARASGRGVRGGGVGASGGRGPGRKRGGVGGGRGGRPGG